MQTLRLSILLSFLSVSLLAGEITEKSRVLLVPLDDRPACLQLPVLLGPIANVDIITPPRPLLGRFTVPGDSSRIADWMAEQEDIDALIVSLDMLAYGGLVASRIHEAEEADAMGRLRAVEEIRLRHPDLPIHAFNIIMRLAPTADGVNEAWREGLARWAELISEIEQDPAAAEEVRRLEKRIPAPALADYKEARARNLAVNRAAIEMVRKGTIDYLILAQDDAKPKGIHVAERLALLELVAEYGLSEKVTVQPGADEVAMLLLSRVLTNRFDTHPTIKPIFSSEAIRTAVAPYEDRPLHETVSQHIAAAGGRETSRADAELLFYVFGSRHEKSIAKPFADQIARDVQAGRAVIVADIDTRGDVQGSAVEFTEALRQHDVFPHLFGYASWNTAGNTIGTALPQGILFALATNHLAENDPQQPPVQEAQVTFLLHRLFSDYLYHSLVRPEINRNYFRERDLKPMELSPDDVRRLEKTILERIRPLAGEIWKDFRRAAARTQPMPHPHYHPEELSEFELALPWGRTFEAEIDLSVSGKIRD